MKQVVLAVDPGKASGIALISRESDSEPVLELSIEVTQLEFANPIRKILAEYEEIDVVCERFLINQQTVRNMQAPYSLEQIGVLKQLMIDFNKNPDAIFMQKPADAKNIFPNDALKKLEYWHRGGEGHALDAIRHALLRLVKTGWKPVGLLS